MPKTTEGRGFFSLAPHDMLMRIILLAPGPTNTFSCILAANGMPVASALVMIASLLMFLGGALNLTRTTPGYLKNRVAYGLHILFSVGVIVPAFLADLNAYRTGHPIVAVLALAVSSYLGWRLITIKR